MRANNKKRGGEFLRRAFLIWISVRAVLRRAPKKHLPRFNCIIPTCLIDENVKNSYILNYSQDAKFGARKKSHSELKQIKIAAPYGVAIDILNGTNYGI